MPGNGATERQQGVKKIAVAQFAIEKGVAAYIMSVRGSGFMGLAVKTIGIVDFRRLRLKEPGEFADIVQSEQRRQKRRDALGRDAEPIRELTAQAFVLRQPEIAHGRDIERMIGQGVIARLRAFRFRPSFAPESEQNVEREIIPRHARSRPGRGRVPARRGFPRRGAADRRVWLGGSPLRASPAAIRAQAAPRRGGVFRAAS